jgi:hypothetical protein
VLAISLADTARARLLDPDGNYHRQTTATDGQSRRSQAEFITLATSSDAAHRHAGNGKSRFPKVKLVPPPFEAEKRKK